MGGGISIRPSGRTPHILSPLCAAAQIMHVALPGQQPADLFGFTEDTRLLLGGEWRLLPLFVCLCAGALGVPISQELCASSDW